MAVNSQPKIRTYRAGGAIVPFSFVKFGADKETILQCGANEKSMGIYQGSIAATSGDLCEVALPGGGALLTVSETVALGKRLTATSAGIAEVVDAAGEEFGAMAYEDGVANDVIGVEVCISTKAVSSDA